MQCTCRKPFCGWYLPLPLTVVHWTVRESTVFLWYSTNKGNSLRTFVGLHLLFQNLELCFFSSSSLFFSLNMGFSAPARLAWWISSVTHVALWPLAELHNDGREKTEHHQSHTDHESLCFWFHTHFIYAWVSGTHLILPSWERQGPESEDVKRWSTSTQARLLRGPKGATLGRLRRDIATS